MRTAWILAAALLAGGLGGCGGSDWARPGIDEAEVAREYQGCRELAATALRTDADIDQDIRATRGMDWQRGGFASVSGRNREDNTRDRAQAIVASCMRAKGFARTR